jgi:hypothetical protein
LEESVPVGSWFDRPKISLLRAVDLASRLKYAGQLNATAVTASDCTCICLSIANLAQVATALIVFRQNLTAKSLSTPGIS